MHRFPHKDRTNGKGKKGRGIGSHTDYGLLVIAAQDEVGGMQYLWKLFSALTLTRKCFLGLFVRPPRQDEQFANWEKTSAGLRENDAGWMYVPPVTGTFTVFPGKQLKAFLRKT